MLMRSGTAVVDKGTALIGDCISIFLAQFQAANIDLVRSLALSLSLSLPLVEPH